MKTKHCLIGLMALAFAVPPATAETSSQSMQPLPPQQLAASNNAFAYDLYAQLKGKEGNLLFSPFSVSTALAMTYAGAKGDSAAQMQKVLHFPASQNDTHAGFAALLKHFDDMQRGGSIQLNMANSVWPQQGAALANDYLALVKQNYGVTITPVDYEHAAPAAKDAINHWVESKTSGKIKNLIGRLGGATRLVLVNAAYFKGDWAQPFSHFMTQQDAPFFTVDGTPSQAPLMSQTKVMPYAAPDGVQLVKMYYKGGQLSMLVILPADKTAAGLRKVENELTAQQVAKWNAQMNPVKVQVFLPSFKFDWGTFSFKAPLQALGMDDAFQGSSADFSGMNGFRAKDNAQGLYIGDVLHKTFVAVDEQGTEAAAATGVLMVAGAARTNTASAPPPIVRADHPFLFLIQDDATESVLFMGRVMNPARH